MGATAITLAGRLNGYVDSLIERYPVLNTVREDLIDMYFLMEKCYENGGKILIAGNGGSAADADHIVGELMKGFKKQRKVPPDFAKRLQTAEPQAGAELAEKLQGALPAIALNNHSALNSAYLNDVDGRLSLAQQVNGYGKAGDVLLGISTSGESKNIIYAAVTARAKDMKVVALTGKTGGRLKELADAAIVVPENETYKIQELHLPVYHCLCLMLEEKFFAGHEWK